jgi:uncharacterized protein YoxC
MVVDVAVGVAAAAFLVLVGYLVATLIRLRQTLIESERLLTRLNAEVPSLAQEARTLLANVNALADDARDGVQHASVFLHAVGELGDTVQHVQGLVRGKGGTLLGNLASVMAGVRAVTAVVKDRLRKEGGDPNGSR